MIKVYGKPASYAGQSLLSVTEKYNSRKEKMQAAIELIKRLPIDGCITGSCMLEDFDPDEWGCKPDIDIFVFSETELVHAIDLAIYGLRMEPGVGTPRSKQQEEWKLERLKVSGVNRKLGITTYKFYRDEIMLNITFKQRKVQGRLIPITSTAQVLESFDMSIVMQGYDIKHHVLYDMRAGDPKVAIPNPLRDHDCVMWTVAKWIRQFDRVVKYYQRGYDTRPMAKFYLEMIDECIKAGCLFDSTESKELFATYSKEFLEKRNDIDMWLKEHEDD